MRTRLATKKKSAMDLRLENIEREGKAAEAKLKSVGENLRAVAESIRKQAR